VIIPLLGIGKVTHTVVPSKNRAYEKNAPNTDRDFYGHFELKTKKIKKISIAIIYSIYAPMIYTAPCVMFFFMRTDPLRWQVGGGWALEIESFLGPVKWHRADRRVPF
jgi:hypothetical protein